MDNYWIVAVIAAVIVVALVAWRALSARRPAERGPGRLSQPPQPLDGGLSTPSPDRLTRTLERAAPTVTPIPATPPVATPAAAAPAEPAAAPMPVAPTAGEADDLTRLKGVGPRLCTLLQNLGITRFDQIAAWTDSDIDAIDSHLGNFRGRIRRDAWVEQAQLLATGQESAFEARFGALGSGGG